MKTIVRTGPELGAKRVAQDASCLSRREFLMAAASASASIRLADAAPVHTLDQRETCFDNGWRFYRGALEGAEAVAFDDASWREVDLPHDWSIEDLPYATSDDGAATTDPASWALPAAPVVIGPFDKAMGDARQAYTVGGEGWYRKRFQLSDFRRGKEFELRLDGVYHNADVWLNGAHVGFHPNGYTPALLNLTAHIRAGTNVVAVRVRNVGPTSRWYPGSGIYRHTWLTVTAAVRLPTFGVAISTPEVSADAATVRVVVDAENKGVPDIVATIDITLLNADGRPVASGTAIASSISAGMLSTYTVFIQLAKPSLWTPNTPHLYAARIRLLQGQDVVDEVTQQFGVRSIAMDARGFLLNGTAVKMRGGCIHSQHGALGAASFDGAEERRVRILKESGFNAVRTAHNPPSPAFLDACDRLGLLVYAEAFDVWDQAKRKDDYHVYFPDWYKRDLEIFIARDRNHPSIVIWSTGNEIKDSIGRAPEIAERVRTLDPSRPVTQGSAMGMADLHETVLTGDAWKYLDVADVHYQLAYEELHKAQPSKAALQSESWVVKLYDNWKGVQDNDSAVGDFVWAAWDYLGEPGVGAARVVDIGAAPLTLKDPFPKVEYPWFQSYCGDIDLIGQPKPQHMYRRVVCGDRPIEIAVERPAPDGKEQRSHMWSWFDELRSWTWDVAPGHKMRVRVYSTGDEVELTLDGKQVGLKRLTEADKCVAVFEVPYLPGALTAVARRAGQHIASQTIVTVGMAAGLRLTAEKEPLVADRGSIAHILVEVVDKNGLLVPDATVRVHFDVAGAGEIAAVGNANPRNLDSYRRPRRYTYHGQAQVVLRSTGKAGKVRLQAKAMGLQSAELGIAVARVPSFPRRKA